MSPTVLTTSRLKLRPLVAGDADSLAEVLSDPASMRWYPHPFSRAEVEGWIARAQQRIETDGVSLWAVERQQDGAFLGDCGLLVQELDGQRVLEVSYHVLPRWQRQGIATEAAQGCLVHARDVLRARALHAFVRPENEPSRRVAARLGMQVVTTRVRGAGDFLHEIWKVELPGGR